ncbi:hypothetical protein IscW_ISCW002218 [Ixodes scapularis]|uniref:Uncharacterized protein n=1 Tax=Ixodes scapularis TaxID=6945 RepID=B7P7G6_IXOSC|nr:hypothetical protein IscW_ISCW002218 [Ixodes scapularis]|eukprot:XP_002399200.1 hypothetical protein IscW_ISCW002218 [Ixodes scapularis]
MGTGSVSALQGSSLSVSASSAHTPYVTHLEAYVDDANAARRLKTIRDLMVVSERCVWVLRTFGGSSIYTAIQRSVSGNSRA